LLGNLYPLRCRHKHGGCGNIEGIRSVATRAAHVQQIVRVADGHRQGELAHDFGRGGDLAHGFFFDPQAHDQRAGDLGRKFAAHQHAHQVQHLVMENFPVLNAARQCLSGGDRHSSSFLVLPGAAMGSGAPVALYV
jgi:hypothetical protein